MSFELGMLIASIACLVGSALLLRMSGRMLDDCRKLQREAADDFRRAFSMKMDAFLAIRKARDEFRAAMSRKSA